MRLAVISTLLALASLATAAPVPRAATALERRFDLVQGHVVPGEGYVPTATVHLGSTPTEIPSTENGGSYFWMPNSLRMIAAPAAAAAPGTDTNDEAALVKRLTPFLVVRPQTAEDGDVPDFVDVLSAEDAQDEANAAAAADVA